MIGRYTDDFLLKNKGVSIRSWRHGTGKFDGNKTSRIKYEMAYGKIEKKEEICSPKRQSIKTLR